MKSGECFLVVGKERLLKTEFIRDLQKKSFQNPSDVALNTQEWDVSENGLSGDVFDFIRTAPFLGQKRIAVLRQIETLEGEGRKRFLEAFKNLPATSILVLISEETGTKKNAFLRDLEAECTLVACHTPFDRDLPDWVQLRAKKIGGSIDREASRALVEKAGKDTGSLQNALEELLLFIHPRTMIGARDVDALLGKTSEEDIFALADDLFQKNTQAALEKITRLFREGLRAPEVIAVLAGQLERMKQASNLLERGASPAEVAAALRVHSFFQQKFFLELKKTSLAAVVRMQKRLLACDVAIKEGRINERLALEKFILES